MQFTNETIREAIKTGYWTVFRPVRNGIPLKNWDTSRVTNMVLFTFLSDDGSEPAVMHFGIQPFDIPADTQADEWPLTLSCTWKRRCGYFDSAPDNMGYVAVFGDDRGHVVHWREAT